MPLSGKLASRTSAAEIITFAVISVVLAQIWLRAFENLFFRTLGLSTSSWWAALVLSLAMTVAIIYFTYYYRTTLIGFL